MMIYHLGCGPHVWPTWLTKQGMDRDHVRLTGLPNPPDRTVGHEDIVNVDLVPWRDDVVMADIRCLDAVATRFGRPDIISAEDVLEHVPIADGRRALGHWTSLIRPSGYVEIQVPDLKALATALYTDTLMASEYVQRLYGAQDYPENTHWAGFTEGLLVQYIQDAGLRVVETNHWNMNLIILARKC